MPDGPVIEAPQQPLDTRQNAPGSITPANPARATARSTTPTDTAPAPARSGSTTPTNPAMAQAGSTTPTGPKAANVGGITTGLAGVQIRNTSPQPGSAPKKSVKHLECAYFFSPSGCKWKNPDHCLYAHWHTGARAGPPIVVEPGRKSFPYRSLCLQISQGRVIKGCISSGFVKP